MVVEKLAKKHVGFSGIKGSACLYFHRLWSLLACPDWFIPLSECSLASPGSPCTNLEAKDCKNGYIGDHCCCGQCSDSPWLSLACVLNATTGSSHWQPIIDSICPAEGCGSDGENNFSECSWIYFKTLFTQALSPHQTILATILTSSRRLRR